MKKVVVFTGPLSEFVKLLPPTPVPPMEGQTQEELWAALYAVYLAYPEYSDPAYGTGDFFTMVQKFAADDFYKLHREAKAFIAGLSCPYEV
jgi:hypothetical protein